MFKRFKWRVFLFSICCTFFCVVALQVLFSTVKPFGSLVDEKDLSQVFFDRKDRLLRVTLSHDEKYRVFTPLKEISDYTKNAALLYEDKYFYYHFGFNLWALGKAFVSTYITKSRRRGASTITMQLAKLKFKLKTGSVLGKFKQISHALFLEFFYSKKDILEAYLNLAPYGYNIEGVGAASLIYFKKKSQDINLIEALTLAVIPQSPYKFTQNINHDKKVNSKLRETRLQMLNIWSKNYTLTADKEDFELDFTLASPRDLPFESPHLIDEFIIKKTTSKKTQLTLDLELQKILERVGEQYIQHVKKKNINNYAALLINAKTMETLAHIGSANFFDDQIFGQVNGVSARRSPGSTLKPFVYALGIDQGLIHTNTKLIDAPTPFGTYTPDNFDYSFVGPISVRNALIYSRNIPALVTAKKLKEPNFYEFLKSAGIRLHPNPDHYGLSLVLGSAELSMKELVELYALFVNEGKHSSIKTVKSFEILEKKKLLSPESAFLIKDVLFDNPPPLEDTFYKWKRNLGHVAWKTGTSMGYKDAWSIGVFDDYVLAVWIGNFSGEGNRSIIGSAAAGPLLFRMIESIVNFKGLEAERAVGTFGLNLKKVKVCSLSGKISHEHCSHHEEAWFIPGVSPIEKCDVHRKIEVDVASGLRSCPQLAGQKEEKVFEYWPSEVLELYRQAGISRKQAPSYHEKCKGDRFGKPAPRVISPKEGLAYSLRQKGEDAKLIPFIARGDGDVKKFEWFVNNLSVGFSKPDRPFIWKSYSGTHEVRVEDDQGKSTTVTLKVEWVE